MSDLRPTHRWRLPDAPTISTDLARAAAERGIPERLLRILAQRGHSSPVDLDAFYGEPQHGLNDPRLLPDADRSLARVRLAIQRGERVLVFGDFDADGLTGLAVMTLCLRRLGLDVAPHVPSRADEGHGLSLLAVERAAAEERSLIVTVDTGSSSVDEVAAASALGIDVIVTDHHRCPPRLPDAAAIVNPHRVDARYPDKRLAGSGVAFTLARLLLSQIAGHADAALDLADLATIGTVADVAPIVGENRAIARIGLERIRDRPRPGVAALLRAARVAPGAATLETVAFALAPRLNAVGRVGDGTPAAQLLLSETDEAADTIAADVEAANGVRRELTKAALEEARALADLAAGDSAIVVAGPWPVGVIGLVAGRLAEERNRPAIVVSTAVAPWRVSARSAVGFDLAGAFAACSDLFRRFGGHPQAAGADLHQQDLETLRTRLLALAEAAGPFDPRPELRLDLVLGCLDLDYTLLRELARLEPAGPGNPIPLIGVEGLVVSRVRPASGGHTQLTLRKGLEVLDGICFGRDDLVAQIREGDRIDVVARLSSRVFGGFESLQLEVRDLAPAGTLSEARRLLATAATQTPARAEEPPALVGSL
jgi:single-stranded-DNA-specific exonuclease